VTQNIYDNDEFLAGYRRLPRSVEGLAGAPEWPSLRDMLPGPAGTRAVDLGCGFGWFCRWARERGAASVLGVDVSEKMLAQARKDTSDDAITYRRADLENLVLDPAIYDFAYSSLAFHSLVNLESLLATVYRALKPDGWLVFSVEHPLYTAPSRPGWLETEDGRKTWPVDGYLEEGPRTTDWLAKGVVKQHRTIGTYVNLLIELGFVLDRLVEWGPTDAQIAARPSLADERIRPMFLLVAARKPT
jgi:SAM-dependent methyltransferase